MRHDDMARGSGEGVSAQSGYVGHATRCGAKCSLKAAASLRCTAARANSVSLLGMSAYIG